MTATPERADVLILGAGLVGLATARELAGRGLDVLLLDARAAGAEASSAGAGLLAPISDWASTRPILEICREARDGWKPWLDELTAETGSAVEYDDSGALLVGCDDADDAHLDAECAVAATARETWREFTLAEARELVPDLAPSIRRVALLAGEHRVDNVAACAALVSSCRLRGVRLHEHTRVTRVEFGAADVLAHTASGSFAAATLVVAAGAWSGTIPGLPALAVRPVRGQMLRLEGAAWPWAGSLRWRSRYVVRRGGAGLLVGATLEEAGFEGRPTASGVSGLLGFASQVFPGLAGSPVDSIWAGLRPGSPDGRPLVGRIDGVPAIAACGHYRNGILLAPWTARVVSDLLIDGRPVPQADRFTPHRFPTAVAGGHPVASVVEPPRTSR